MAKEGLNRRNLVISIFLSLVIWGFLVGVEFACVLIFSILVHEYGHYWWMGREGIRERDMIMIPPLGALAISKERWPSYGAEARIALAGPFFGLIPAVIFAVLAIVTSNTFWFAAAGIAAVINVLNLIPAIPLDGGRSFRAVLVSIHPGLRTLSRMISITIIVLLFLNGFLIAAIFIGYMFFREESMYFHAERLMKIAKSIKSSCAHMLPDKSLKMIDNEPAFENAKAIYNMPRMNSKEISVIIGLNILIIYSHFFLYKWAIVTLGIENFFGLYKFLQ